MNLNTGSIHVENPCPVALFRLRNKNGHHFCDSCQKHIIDFRESNLNEIKSKCDENTCGIFNLNQIRVPEKSLSYRFRFAILTMLSVLGFHVSPLNAQKKLSGTNIHFPSSRQTELDKNHAQPPAKFEPVKPSPQKNQAGKRRKKKTRTFVGCPSF